MEAVTILAALGPLVVELGRGLLQKYVTPDSFKPTSVAEWLQMRAAEIDLFKAMQDQGAGQGKSWPWVDAVIRLQRPAVATIVLGVWAMQEFTVPGGATDATQNFAGAVGFYLFGDRTLFYGMQAAGKKKA